MPRDNEYLIFIDTNIYLDFYRLHKDISLGLLRELDKVRDRLISSQQVEMEFKKNRQTAILESLARIVSPQSISFPAFRSQIESAKIITKKMDDIEKRIRSYRDYTVKIMLDPTHRDEVYRYCQRIFNHQSSLNLNRSKKIRYTIRGLARKRFLLGYPPRKERDTSIGDAINWEWIVRCCEENKKSVVIVSRDGDYGISYQDKSFLNDWLADEFRRRVSRRRRAVLVGKLSEGLKILGVTVSKKAKDAEKSLRARVQVLPPLVSVSSSSVSSIPTGPTGPTGPAVYFTKVDNATGTSIFTPIMPEEMV